MSHILTLNPTSLSESPAAWNPQPSLRVVAIGGGTGLSTLLRGLKRYVPAPAASRRASDAPARTRPAAEPVPGPAFPPGSPADRRDQLIEGGRHGFIGLYFEKLSDAAMYTHPCDLGPAFDLDALDLIIARFLVNLDP